MSRRQLASGAEKGLQDLKNARAREDVVQRQFTAGAETDSWRSSLPTRVKRFLVM
jgi:hypothetical protein